MILYVDSENKIRAVDKTTDPTLTPIEIADEDNPFLGHSDAFICCYMITVEEIPIYPEVEIIENSEEEPEPPEPIGYKTIITMMTPYIDSKTLDAIDMMGHQMEAITPYTVTKTAYIEDTSVTFTDVPDGTMSVFVKDTEGNYPHYTTERTENRVIIHFAEPLTKVTTVTISIL